MYTKTRIPTVPIIMIALLTLTLVAAAPASCAVHHGGTNADLVTTVNELSPQPVEPGRDLILAVTIDNRGGGVANGVTLTIMPDSPIILKSENDRVMRFEKIIGHGARVETYLLERPGHAIREDHRTRCPRRDVSPPPRSCCGFR
jgi:hypothetical protein